MSEIKAKLVRKIKSDVAWYFDKYELECIECGTHYINGRYDNRTCPYCPDCRQKHDKIRTQKNKEKKRKELDMAIRNKAIDDFIKECDKFCGYYKGENKNITREDMLNIAAQLKEEDGLDVLV